MKGVNSYDENGYWSRYSNGNWSVCKIYDDVLGYEYTLFGESFDALEVVDKLASLESQLAEAKAKLAWVSVSERLPEDGEVVWLWDGNNLGMGYYLIFSGCFMDRDTPLRQIKPTHWMPLPELPEVKE